MKLKNKVAIVTGAAGGIGRAHALRLARLGVDVVINDIDLGAYKKFGEIITEDSVVAEVSKIGVRCIGIEADVSDKTGVEQMVEKVLGKWGHIDILVNNAGGGVIGDAAAEQVANESFDGVGFVEGHPHIDPPSNLL